MWIRNMRMYTETCFRSWTRPAWMTTWKNCVTGRCDLTATPQGLCASLVNEEILSKTKIIDLSADFRLKDVNVYEELYKIEHKAPQYIDEAVYGLCEINREDVKKSPTGRKSGLLHNLFHPDGLSAGKRRAHRYGHPDHRCQVRNVRCRKRRKTSYLFCEVNENIKAYGVATHRHTPEIEEQLGYAAGEKVVLNFTPHLVPMTAASLRQNMQNSQKT